MNTHYLCAWVPCPFGTCTIALRRIKDLSSEDHRKAMSKAVIKDQSLIDWYSDWQRNRSIASRRAK